MTFKEIYESIKRPPITPRQKWIKNIAQATFKSETTVRNWICGVQTPDQLTQQKISEILNVPAEELFPLKKQKQ